MTFTWAKFRGKYGVSRPRWDCNPFIDILKRNKLTIATPASIYYPKNFNKPKLTIATPGKKILFVDIEKIKTLETKKGKLMFKFVPSKTNFEQAAFEFVPSRGFNQLCLFTNSIDPYITTIKKFVDESFGFVRNYEFLMDFAKEVLHILRFYLDFTKTSPYFSRASKTYRKPYRCRSEGSNLPSENEYVNICGLAENGCAVYPDSLGIAEADRLTVDKGHGYNLPLNEKERKLWLDFKKLDEGIPESALINFTFEENEKRSIILSDSVVSVIGGFAVAAFNKACSTHFKKDEQNNVHDFEYMECKYMKNTRDYVFYITIEAIEEGNLGVYETSVLCSRDDGRRTLLKFVLTDRTPVGMKAKAISLFSWLRSLCMTLQFLGTARWNRLVRIKDMTTGRERGKPWHEMVLFLYFHDQTVDGIRRVLSVSLQLLFQPDCARTNTWSAPDPNFDTSMKPRNNGTPCKGYDYNPNNRWGQVYMRMSKCRTSQGVPRGEVEEPTS